MGYELEMSKNIRILKSNGAIFHSLVIIVLLTAAGFYIFENFFSLRPPQHGVVDRAVPASNKAESELFKFGDSAENIKVKAYVTSWCPYCKKLERLLQENKIKYERYDIEADARGEREYRALGGSGIPVVVIGKRVIHGFDEGTIRDALGLK